MSRKTALLLSFFFAFLAACNEQPAPTPILEPPPTVTAIGQVTEPAATPTGQPPTAVPATTEAPTASADAPTPTDIPETPEATATSTLEPTAESANLAIDSPMEGEILTTGSSLAVSGTAPPDTDEVSVSLRAAGLILTSVEVTPTEEGNWEATLEVPATLTGTALVRVAAGEEDTVETPVQITLPGATSGPAITLDYPQATSTVVSGHVLFFTGTVQRPPDQMVTIAVLFEDCQTVASTTSFDVGEGGQWWGYIVVPETVFGPGCALAYMGEFGEGNWRAAHTPISILEVDDPQAIGVFIGNFANSELTPGESVIVYGSAYNAPNNRVPIVLQIGGENVAQGTATTDGFGYWEINLVLPPDTSPDATGQFRATVAYDGEEISETTPFEVVPRP